MNLDTVTPSDVRELMARTGDITTLRSLAKLYDALNRGDDMLRIEAEDELDGVNLEAA